MRTAYALLRKGKVFVQGNSRTTAGLSIADGPVQVVDPADTDALGAAVRAALDSSRAGLPHPSPDGWRQVQAPMLAAAGVKSWATLAKGTAAVGIEERLDGVVRFTPTESYGAGGGQALSGEAIEASPDAASLGKAFQQALARCR